ncbi:hypothetical protein EPYR_00382 [Erwinia pyrifoliae DSM 12163]|nr:hypothetical protein EPYR_00382 [Erwinia pyrifoliae DSM 12163]
MAIGSVILPTATTEFESVPMQLRIGLIQPADINEA